nr:hypothetical protein [Tanacetum cinerariifolium]
MKESGIYAVKNFVVVPNKNEYRIFKQDMFMLEFDRETTIRNVSVDPHGYLRYPFRLVDLDQIEVTNSKGYSLRDRLWGGLVDSSLPREGTLENLLIWARNCQNNTVTFHCMVMIENFRNKKGWNYPSCGYEKCKNGAARQLRKWFCEVCNRSIDYLVFRYRLEVVADDTTSTVVVMFNDTATKLIKCSAKSLMVGDDEGADAYSDSNLPTTIRNLVGTAHVLEIKSHTYYEYGSFESFTCWKINSIDPVDDVASSSTRTLTTDEASLSFKRLAKHLTMKTPSKPNEEKKKKGVSKCFITIQDTDRHSYLHYLTTFISFHYSMLELEDSDGDEACPT